MNPFVSTLRMRLFLVSAMNRLPRGSAATPSGQLRAAFVARPPSPEYPPRINVARQLELEHALAILRDPIRAALGDGLVDAVDQHREGEAHPVALFIRERLDGDLREAGQLRAHRPIKAVFAVGLHRRLGEQVEQAVASPGTGRASIPLTSSRSTKKRGASRRTNRFLVVVTSLVASPT